MGVSFSSNEKHNGSSHIQSETNSSINNERNSKIPFRLIRLDKPLGEKKKQECRVQSSSDKNEKTHKKEGEKENGGIIILWNCFQENVQSE